MRDKVENLINHQSDDVILNFLRPDDILHVPFSKNEIVQILDIMKDFSDVCKDFSAFVVNNLSSL